MPRILRCTRITAANSKINSEMMGNPSDFPFPRIEISMTCLAIMKRNGISANHNRILPNVKAAIASNQGAFLGHLLDIFSINPAPHPQDHAATQIKHPATTACVNVPNTNNSNSTRQIQPPKLPKVNAKASSNLSIEGGDSDVLESFHDLLPIDHATNQTAHNAPNPRGIIAE